MTSIWDAFTCWLSKRVLQRHLLESGLTKIFKISNFRNTLAMKIIFIFKCSKFDVGSRNGTKNSEKHFRFWDNSISIGSCKFSQTWTRYLALAVNVLTYTPKTSPKTRRDTFGINFPENDETTWQKRSHRDFASVWGAFTYWLSNRLLKWRFLESGLTKIFTVSNFRNTLAETIILFFKIFQIWCRFQKWNKKLRKTFLFLR